MSDLCLILGISMHRASSIQVVVLHTINMGIFNKLTVW